MNLSGWRAPLSGCALIRRTSTLDAGQPPLDLTFAENQNVLIAITLGYRGPCSIRRLRAIHSLPTREAITAIAVRIITPCNLLLSIAAFVLTPRSHQDATGIILAANIPYRRSGGACCYFAFLRVKGRTRAMSSVRNSSDLMNAAKCPSPGMTANSLRGAYIESK